MRIAKPIRWNERTERADLGHLIFCVRSKIFSNRFALNGGKYNHQ